MTGTTAPGPAAWHIFAAAAHRAGLAHVRFDDRPHGMSVFSIPVPTGGEIWISNEDATVDHEPEAHTGWIAAYYPKPADSDENETVYESTSTDCAADSVACVEAVGAWLAAH